MDKYIVGELLKQGDECIILDGVAHKLESEYCDCIRTPHSEQELDKNYCIGCGKPIKPKREYKHTSYGWCGICKKIGSCKHLQTQPKRELPEKFSNIEKDLIGDRLIRPIVGKIEEILDYLK